MLGSFFGERSMFKYAILMIQIGLSGVSRHLEQRVENGFGSE